MASTFLLAVCLFLASLVTLTIGQGVGVQCGSFRCTENAICVNGECICNTGFVGYGRFICVPTGQCPCATFGDPHVDQYDRSRVRSTLPCQFVLSGFTAPATTLPCDVQVEIVTKPRTNPTYPFRTFTERIKVKIIRDNTQLVFEIGPTGVLPASPVGTIFTATEVISGIDLTAVVSTFNNFNRVTVPECTNIIFGYDPINMAAMTGTPMSGAVFPGEGLCGNCNGNANDDNPFDAQTGVGVTPTEAARAFSLRQMSTEQSTADGTRCTSIKNAANGTCSSDTALVEAVRCCDIYYDSTYANCLLQNAVIPVSREGLLDIFYQCLDFFCVQNLRNVAGTLSNAFTSTGCALPVGYVCPP